MMCKANKAALQAAASHDNAVEAVAEPAMPNEAPAAAVHGGFAGFTLPTVRGVELAPAWAGVGGSHSQA